LHQPTEQENGMSAEIHEIVALQDVFASDTGLIEDIGCGCVRL
jgi:hypothetical protein